MASRLARSRLFHLDMSFPSKSTEPSSCAISLEIIPITVDLPAPLGPISEITFPFGSSKETPSTTVFPLYFFKSSLTNIVMTSLCWFFHTLCGAARSQQQIEKIDSASDSNKYADRDAVGKYLLHKQLAACQYHHTD